MGTWSTKEKKRAYEAEYRRTHPERRLKLREYNRAHYARNREAQTERSLAWWRANKERAAIARRRWQDRNVDWARARDWNRHLKERGLTPEGYNAMREAQGDRCAICGDQDGRLYVDHDHKTGRVRGLLCPMCNLALGGFRDSPALLASAARYLTP